jgi:hypothetical protein
MWEAFTRDVLCLALGKFPISGLAGMGCMVADISHIRWLVYKIIDIIRHRSVQHNAVIATGIVTCSMVIISILSAFPWVRKSVHHLESLTLGKTKTDTYQQPSQYV